MLPHLRQLNQALLEQTPMKYEQLNGTVWEEPARRIYAYVAEAKLALIAAARLDIQAAIYRFQRDWSSWIYLTSGYNGTQGCPMQPSFLVPVSPEVQRQANQTIAALKEQNQSEGRQWIRSEY